MSKQANTSPTALSTTPNSDRYFVHGQVARYGEPRLPSYEIPKGTIGAVISEFGEVISLYPHDGGLFRDHLSRDTNQPVNTTQDRRSLSRSLSVTKPKKRLRRFVDIHKTRKDIFIASGNTGVDATPIPKQEPADIKSSEGRMVVLEAVHSQSQRNVREDTQATERSAAFIVITGAFIGAGLFGESVAGRSGAIIAALIGLILGVFQYRRLFTKQW